MITIETAKVYRGGGRRYLTLRSAVHAEAKKLIETKYPTERVVYGSHGEIEDPGWYWRDGLKRSDVLFRRVCRLVKAGAATPGQSQGGGET
jgi:hypothetical protein